jgi:hypothetical protein
MRRLLSYNYLYLVPMLLSALFSLRAFRLKWPPAYKIFSFFLITSFLVEAFAIAWKWELYKSPWWSYSRSNMWIYDAFVTIRYLFIVLFFYRLMQQEKTRKIILYSLVPFLLLAIPNYIFLQGPHTVNTYTIIFAYGATVIFTLFYFHHVVKQETLVKLTREPAVWISLGLFLYHAVTLPFFIFFNYLLTEQPALANTYLEINDALNIIMYTLFLISFLCTPMVQK